MNIGSGAGIQGARALPQAAHAAAKGAVIALTRQLAAEGVAVGIRVNCVSPGVMATPPVLAMFEEFGENAPVAPIIERTIDGKPGDPLAVAYAGLYLASDEAKWVTGITPGRRWRSQRDDVGPARPAFASRLGRRPTPSVNSGDSVDYIDVRNSYISTSETLSTPAKRIVETSPPNNAGGIDVARSSVPEKSELNFPTLWKEINIWWHDDPDHLTVTTGARIGSYCQPQWAQGFTMDEAGFLLRVAAPKSAGCDTNPLQARARQASCSWEMTGRNSPAPALRGEDTDTGNLPRPGALYKITSGASACSDPGKPHPERTR